MSWLNTIAFQQQEILLYLRAIKQDTTVLREGQAQLLRITNEINNKLAVTDADLALAVDALRVVGNHVDTDTDLLEQILKKLTPQPAVSAIATLSTP